MYASIRRYEGVTNPSEVARRVREGFVPLVQGMEGFVAYYWVDAGAGVVITTSVFDSQAAAEESNRKSAEWLKANVAGMVAEPMQLQITSGIVGAEAHAEARPRSERKEAARESPAARH